MTRTADSLTITELLERAIHSDGAVATVERLAKLLQEAAEPEERHLGYCLSDALDTHNEEYP